MPGLELFLVFTRPLDALGLPYMATGALASVVYGEPRMTHDIDLVVELRPGDASRVVAAYPSDDFYCPPEEAIRVEIARRERGHFNLIHHRTGYKADIFLKGSDPLHQWALPARRRVELGSGEALFLAPPEYVILRKLEFYREAGSERHLRDVAGILAVSGDLLDRQLLEMWVERLGLTSVWQEVNRAE